MIHNLISIYTESDINCAECNIEYNTLISTIDGMPIKIFCSDKCGEEYYKPISQRREEKLQLLLQNFIKNPH